MHLGVRLPLRMVPGFRGRSRAPATKAGTRTDPDGRPDGSMAQRPRGPDPGLPEHRPPKFQESGFCRTRAPAARPEPEPAHSAGNTGPVAPGAAAGTPDA